MSNDESKPLTKREVSRMWAELRREMKAKSAHKGPYERYDELTEEQWQELRDRLGA